mmetsp:Transcript_32296/g.63163  ORF Transcript_32296/g.63163 Transcript_32296/m.63163 type:complete len:82 (+) Transcript_32296:565-810(+)
MQTGERVFESNQFVSIHHPSSLLVVLFFRLTLSFLFVTPGIMYIYLCVFMVATNVLNKINSSSSPKVQTNLDGDASPASMV